LMRAADGSRERRANAEESIADWPGRVGRRLSQRHRWDEIEDRPPRGGTALSAQDEAGRKIEKLSEAESRTRIEHAGEIVLEADSDPAPKASRARTPDPSQLGTSAEFAWSSDPSNGRTLRRQQSVRSDNGADSIRQTPPRRHQRIKQTQNQKNSGGIIFGSASAITRGRMGLLAHPARPSTEKKPASIAAGARSRPLHRAGLEIGPPIGPWPALPHTGTREHNQKWRDEAQYQRPKTRPRCAAARSMVVRFNQRRLTQCVQDFVQLCQI